MEELAGKLKLSEVPEKLWMYLMVDFIIKLPVKFTNSRLSIFSILLFIFIFIPFYFLFSIFRTTRVRTDWSHCHISHNLMA